VLYSFWTCFVVLELNIVRFPALFEYKVILAALIKAFEFLPVEGPTGNIETRFTGTTQPYVVGREEEGVTIPLRVRCI